MAHVPRQRSRATTGALCTAALLAAASCGAKGAAAPGGEGGSFSDGGAPLGDSTVYGTSDGAPTTGLPPLPTLGHVTATVVDDSVDITFDPVAGAADYRVYPLPADSAIGRDASGRVVIKDAVYRCGGGREAPKTGSTGGGQVPTVVAGDVLGYTRSSAEETLGYVYTDPGAGLVPVYRLGDSAADADNDCGFRWTESRSATYTTDATQRATLLAKGWRDDGIQFYVPSAGGAGTVQVYGAQSSVFYGSCTIDARLYFTDGPEKAARASLSPAPAFSVLSSPAAGTEPLLRVNYQVNCDNQAHDVLVVGKGRFERAVSQGDSPEWKLHWAGLTGPTTLVVEALDSQCPFHGALAPQALPLATSACWPPSSHQPFSTVAQAQAAASTGEVFVNGEGPATNVPQAVARSFITVAPTPKPAYDWFAGFNDAASFPPLTDQGDGGFQGPHLRSSLYDVYFDSLDLNATTGIEEYAIGPMLGELWVTYADFGSDSNGKFRLAPLQMASLSSTSFLHVTMSVDSFGTDRRYPQILISNQAPPVQPKLPMGKTIIVQTFSAWPSEVQIQFCNLRDWDVNNQCPFPELEHVPYGSGGYPPIPVVGESFGSDNQAHFDVYASTTQVYAFLDGQPYGCADLSAVGGMPAGPVSVSFGDVLYHSGADLGDGFEVYHTAHMDTETERHYDNLGFTSGVARPAWDSARFPCKAMPAM